MSGQAIEDADMRSLELEVRGQSLRVDRIRDHENPGRLQPADLALVALEAGR